jgi:trimethylamine corrinoid protein
MEESKMMIKEELIQGAIRAVTTYNVKAAKEIAQESINAKVSPIEMIQDGFTKAMVEIGDKYGEGKLFLPHVVAAANAMEAGVAVLTPEIERLGTAGKQKTLGTVAIGTIEGDVHCIGKDITAIMLKVAGFDVINLGRDVPYDKFIEEARNGANFIGSSALMTTTMAGQLRIEEALKVAGLKGKVKTMVGGAPVSQEWADKIGADIYGKNSTEGVNKCLSAVGKG